MSKPRDELGWFVLLVSIVSMAAFGANIYKTYKDTELKKQPECMQCHSINICKRQLNWNERR